MTRTRYLRNPQTQYCIIMCKIRFFDLISGFLEWKKPSVAATESRENKKPGSSSLALSSLFLDNSAIHVVSFLYYVKIKRGERFGYSLILDEMRNKIVD